MFELPFEITLLSIKMVGGGGAGWRGSCVLRAGVVINNETWTAREGEGKRRTEKGQRGGPRERILSLKTLPSLCGLWLDTGHQFKPKNGGFEFSAWGSVSKISDTHTPLLGRFRNPFIRSMYFPPYGMSLLLVTWWHWNLGVGRVIITL